MHETVDIEGIDLSTGVERIKARINNRILRNRLEGKRTSAAQPIAFTPLKLARRATVSVHDYQRKRWHLAELLNSHDRQFVQQAYLVLLKRDADIDGLTGRLQSLQSGEISRLELLFRLRYGAEGKQHAVKVAGLERAFLIERLCALPVVGILPRYIRALVRLPRMQREIEELRGMLAMQKNDSDDVDRMIIDFQNEQFTKIHRK